MMRISFATRISNGAILLNNYTTWYREFDAISDEKAVVEKELEE